MVKSYGWGVGWGGGCGGVGGPWDSSDSPSPLVLGFGDLGTWGLGTGLVKNTFLLILRSIVCLVYEKHSKVRNR